ncbi:hypothetical protein GCM10027048_04880 [Hymenobacter coalescens]
MAQVLHGSARTTQAVRRAIQRSQESLQSLAQRHGIAPKTVAKWRKRTSTQDAPMGPKPASTVLSPEEEAAAVAFRQHTQLPLDDGLYALQAGIPRLTRSALHRLFQRHGISRLPPSVDGKSPAKKKFKHYPIGYLHVDFAEVHTEQGRVYLFVAIDRTSKVAFAELHPRATRALAAAFLRRVLQVLPYKAHTVLTDNGVQFTLQAHQWFPGGHSFDRICEEFGVEHRLTKPAHPWTNGQVECMNRTLKEATVLRYHYETTEQLNEHLQAFLLAHNHAKRLKTLRGLTPHEFICAHHQKNSAIFSRDPTQLTLGLYT